MAGRGNFAGQTSPTSQDPELHSAGLGQVAAPTYPQHSHRHWLRSLCSSGPLTTVLTPHHSPWETGKPKGKAIASNYSLESIAEAIDASRSDFLAGEENAGPPGGVAHRLQGKAVASLITLIPTFIVIRFQSRKKSCKKKTTPSKATCKDKTMTIYTLKDSVTSELRKFESDCARLTTRNTNFMLIDFN